MKFPSRFNKEICILFLLLVLFCIWFLNLGINSSGDSGEDSQANMSTSRRGDVVIERDKDPERIEAIHSLEETLEFVDWLKDFLIRDEREALEYLSGINPFDWEPSYIFPVLVEHFANKNDVFGAIEILEILRGGKADFLFLETVSGLLGQHSSEEDPKKIVSFLLESRNEEIKIRSSRDAGGQLIRNKDIETRNKIVDLILSVPDETTSLSLADGALSRWAVEDLEELGNFLQGRPVNQKLDHGYEVLSHYSKREDPVSALGWALTIQDSERRYESASYSAREFALRDPQGFNQWFETVEDPQLRAVVDEIINVKGYEVDLTGDRGKP